MLTADAEAHNVTSAYSCIRSTYSFFFLFFLFICFSVQHPDIFLFYLSYPENEINKYICEYISIRLFVFSFPLLLFCLFVSLKYSFDRIRASARHRKIYSFPVHKFKIFLTNLSNDPNWLTD